MIWPKSRADLKVSEQRRGEGIELYILRDEESDKSYALRPVEYSIFRSLDGMTSIREITQRLERNGCQQGIMEADIGTFVRDLSAKGLLENDGMFTSSLVQYGENRRPWFVYYKLRLFNLHELFKKVNLGTPPSQRALKTLAAVLGTGLTVAAIIALSLHRMLTDTTTASGFTLLDTNYLFELYALLLLSAVFHELAHGITLEWLGGSAGEAGIIFFFCQPLFYCNANAVWLLQDRWKRTAVSAAGIVADLFLSGVLLLLYVLLSLAGRHADMLLSVSVLLVGKVALNLIPFFRLDGYFIFSDLLGEHNLMKNTLFYIFKKIKGVAVTESEKTKSRVYASYSVICAMSFILVSVTIFVCGEYFADARLQRGIAAANLVSLLFLIPLAGFLAATVRKYWRQFNLEYR